MSRGVVRAYCWKEDTMIDTGTNKPLRVSDYGEVGASIKVSVKHLKRLSDHLSQHGIAYWVDHHAVSVDGQPMVTEIYLRRGTDPQQVQAILDGAA
jgi:hypothetical protein